MAANKSKYLIIIAGPTAVGKTSIAIELAKYYRAEIFSCDSRQIYKEMNIGTAKPSALELESAKHHFISSKSILEDYTAGDYEREVDLALKVYFESRDIAIMTGGTGLYIKAVVEGLDHFPEVPLDILQKLNAELDKHGIAHLAEQLRSVDPLAASAMDLENSRRIIRALAVCHASGLPYSSFLNNKKKQLNYTPVPIVISMDREQLYKRINKRVENMVKAGLEMEVKSLASHQNRKSLQTVGYKELFAYFNGETSKSEAIELIKRNSRRYAKRQITWFKNQRNFHSLLSDFNQIQAYINTQIKSAI